MKIYDTVIIGSGPAGMSAAIYASRAEMAFCVIEKASVSGGQVLSTYEVDNYPGLPGLSGGELAARMREHCEKLGCEFLTAEVTDIIPGIIATSGFFSEISLQEIKSEAGRFSAEAAGVDSWKNLVYMITLDNSDSVLTKTIVAATGASHRRLGVKGEEEFSGMGVSYCATCDGAFFKNKDVVVVGGGDVALEDAIFLSRICRKVYLVHRRNEFRAAKTLVTKAGEADNIEIILNSTLSYISGNDMVESAGVKNVETGYENSLAVSGVFIAVGIEPSTSLFSGLTACNEGGYIIADETGRTGTPGIYAAGDCRKKPLRQIITAAADGANCITSIEAYL